MILGNQRSAGLLLHPTSLPGPGLTGDIGLDARYFVDFLANCGFGIWQLLPLNPPHADGSPYQSQSAHAGNPQLISLQRIADWGWLDSELICEAVSSEARARLMVLSRQAFEQNANADDRASFQEFKQKHAHWINDYGLYRALRRHFDDLPWWKWPQRLRDRVPDALEEVRGLLQEHVAQCIFEQYVFFRQWHELRDYANSKNVKLFGDMPIFVALDSADVWCEPHLFDLDEKGEPRHVAGVPPDYFSSTGQLWGNPCYNWDKMQEEGFDWWKKRLATQLELFDFLRVDHFRGFVACWAIPANESTAINGSWVPAPGRALFDELIKTFGYLPLVAEDLGIITPDVEAFRDDYGLPGMKVLQFAFEGGAQNPYLPHNHKPNFVVYTGTHDNDTTLGWYRSLPPDIQNYINHYLGFPGEPMPWPIIRTAFCSVADLAVVPMQDILGLGSEARMNTPGTHGDQNWRWRFNWDKIESGLCERVRMMIEMYGRK